MVNQLSSLMYMRDEARLERLRRDLAVLKASRVKRPTTTSPRRPGKLDKLSAGEFLIDGINMSATGSLPTQFDSISALWPSLAPSDRPIGRDMLNPLNLASRSQLRLPLKIPPKSRPVHEVRSEEDEVNELRMVRLLPAIVSNNHGFDPAGSGVFDLACLGARPGRGLPRARSFRILPAGADDDD